LINEDQEVYQVVPAETSGAQHDHTGADGKEGTVAMTTQEQIDKAIEESIWRGWLDRYERAELILHTRACTAQTEAWLATFTAACDAARENRVKVRKVDGEWKWRTDETTSTHQ
jgi:hypothetical protein